MSELRDHNGRTEAEYLEEYKTRDYPKPGFTVDMAVFRESIEDEESVRFSDSLNSISNSLELLLVKRGRHPFLGCWALPGGFVEPGETAEQAAARELEEETGLVDVALEQFGVYSAINRDPRAWTVSTGFMALLEGERALTAGDDAAEAEWFAMNVKRNKDKNLVLIASNSETQLRCEFNLHEQRFDAPRVEVVSAEGFAFDHAQLVADAYIRATY